MFRDIYLGGPRKRQISFLALLVTVI